MISVLVVAAVIRRPVQNRVLKGTGTEDQGEKAHRPLGLKRKVRKKTVISERDAQACRDHVKSEYAPQDPVHVVLEEVDRCRDDAEQSNDKQKRGIGPINPIKGNTMIHKVLFGLAKSQLCAGVQLPRGGLLPLNCPNG